PVVTADIAAVAKTWQTNQEGPLRYIQAAWAATMADKGGVIINVASLGGIKPTPGIGVYNISKAALIHMTRQLAIELAPAVRVNALAPGIIKTSFSRALYEHDEMAVAARQPMARLGTPDDVASAALFAAGPPPGPGELRQRRGHGAVPVFLVLLAERELPADVGLRRHGMRPLAQGQHVEGAARPGGEPRAVEEHAGTVDEPRPPP